jgi:signal transduction histidine kinase
MNESVPLTKGSRTTLAHFRSWLNRVHVYELLVAVPTILVLAWLLVSSGFEQMSDPRVAWGALFWTVTIAVVELLPVPAWRSLQVGTGFPLYTAVAFIYPPSVAGVVAFVASSDPREIRGEVSVTRALFNRSQLALALLCASAVFHGLGGSVDDWAISLAIAAPLSVLVFHILNTGLVSRVVALSYEIPVGAVLRHMRIGNPQEFLVSYLGLGLLGVTLARLYFDVGWWAVAAFVMPLLLARQMFFRTRALEEATKELQDREVVLRALSNRMAEERQDERKAIAGYLHDDLAQVLYRMSLHLDISEKQLDSGHPEKLREEIEGLRHSRDRAMELVRGLIKDLHRSPLGREGLNEALRSYGVDVQKQTGVRIETKLEEAPMAAPVQLLCYHVAREAVMNAVKHAEASTITIALEKTADGARLKVNDNGKGFDVEEGEPEGHYGLTMMKERAQVSGGSFRIDSARGKGTTVIADFPTSWLIDPPAAEQDSADAPADGLPTSQR